MNLSKEKQEQLKYHARELGKLLKEQHEGNFSTFEEGEQLLRKTLLGEVNPEIAQFFFAKEKN